MLERRKPIFAVAGGAVAGRVRNREDEVGALGAEVGAEGVDGGAEVEDRCGAGGDLAVDWWEDAGFLGGDERGEDDEEGGWEHGGEHCCGCWGG